MHSCLDFINFTRGVKLECFWDILSLPPPEIYFQKIGKNLKSIKIKLPECRSLQFFHILHVDNPLSYFVDLWHWTRAKYWNLKKGCALFHPPAVKKPFMKYSPERKNKSFWGFQVDPHKYFKTNSLSFHLQLNYGSAFKEVMVFFLAGSLVSTNNIRPGKVRKDIFFSSERKRENFVHIKIIMSRV